MNDFEQPFDRRSAGSIKWSRYPEDVLPMWVADMDFLPPRNVLQALVSRVELGEFGYPADFKRARESIVDWLSSRHDWTIKAEDIVFLPGVVTGFNLAARAAALPGEGVIIQVPAYRPFYQVAEHAGLKEIRTSLRPDSAGTFQLDLDFLQSQADPAARLFLLCNPHNPTGRVFTREELLAIADFCLRNQLLICSDEIHSDLIYENNVHLPIASLDREIAENTITLISPSKTFNLAGLKAAAAVITNPGVRADFINAQQGLVSHPNILGVTALQAAYDKGGEWLKELHVVLGKNRHLLTTAVQKDLPGVKLDPPEGTFLAWLDFRGTGLSDPHQHLLDQARVAVNPGTWFGPAGKGFVRLNFGCPEYLLREGLTRIADVL